ncbi:hypothetical protein ACTMU2_34525 [Cupriavidus basilensis]
MLAGLPKAPSAYNPVVNPEARQDTPGVHPGKAHARPALVSRRSSTTPGPARNNRKVRTEGNEFSTHAEYVAEIVRQLMYAQYREGNLHARPHRLQSTLTKPDQDAACESVRSGIMNYERKHGYRRPRKHSSILLL